jgi:hypothetical protein
MKSIRKQLIETMIENKGLFVTGFSNIIKTQYYVHIWVPSIVYRKRSSGDKDRLKSVSWAFGVVFGNLSFVLGRVEQLKKSTFNV